MDNLQFSQVHKTGKVTFIRQVPWCALVQSPSLSLQEQELRKPLFTSDIFGSMTRIAVMVNSSGLGQTAGWRPLTFALSLPWKLACCHSLLCSVPWPTGQDLGQLTASWLPSIKSCNEDAQAVPTQRMLRWQLTLSLGLVDRIPNGEGAHWGQDFSPLCLSHFPYGSIHFEARSLTKNSWWCSN